MHGDMYPKGSGNSYAVYFLSLGMLWHSFHNVIKENDGDHIIGHQNFLLTVFKTPG